MDNTIRYIFVSSTVWLVALPCTRGSSRMPIPCVGANALSVSLGKKQVSASITEAQNLNRYVVQC